LNVARKYSPNLRHNYTDNFSVWGISFFPNSSASAIIWVSLRSVDDFPANQVAEQFFNGGGHLNAAGGRIYGTMEDALGPSKVRAPIIIFLLPSSITIGCPQWHRR
jgi:hypothetical protein